MQFEAFWRKFEEISQLTSISTTTFSTHLLSGGEDLADAVLTANLALWTLQLLVLFHQDAWHPRTAGWAGLGPVWTVLFMLALCTHNQCWPCSHKTTVGHVHTQPLLAMLIHNHCWPCLHSTNVGCAYMQRMLALCTYNQCWPCSQTINVGCDYIHWKLALCTYN